MGPTRPTGPIIAAPEAGAGSAQFVQIAPWYDTLMCDVPYDMWLRYLTALVHQHAVRPERLMPCRVLDLACGTGSMTFRMEGAGCAVTGVDVAPAMIEAARRNARERGSRATFLVQDAGALDVGVQSYDLCVSLFDSVNYITDPAALESAFARVRRALADDALFVFDVNTPYALRGGFFDQQDNSPSSPVRYQWRSSYDEATAICTVDMEFWVRSENGAEGHFSEVHRQRAYETTELVRMLADAGFADMSCLHAYTFDPCTPLTDRAFIVARADGRSKQQPYGVR